MEKKTLKKLKTMDAKSSHPNLQTGNLFENSSINERDIGAQIEEKMREQAENMQVNEIINDF